MNGKITRRTALKAAPAVAALAVPAVALAGDETEVERLFREWKAARAAYRAQMVANRGLAYEEITREYEEHFDGLVAAACVAGDEVIAAPSVCERDILLKVIALSEDMVEPNALMDGLIAEAAKLAGEVL